MIDIDVRGVEEIKQFMTALGSHGKRVINQELHKIAVDVRNDMIKSMRNTYKDPNKSYNIGGGRIHIASAEGFPPAIRSGNLVNRLFVEKGYDYSMVYTNNVKYAKWLEEGTDDGRIAPRPFFEPAINRSNWERRILNRITAERFAGRRLEG